MDWFPLPTKFVTETVLLHFTKDDAVRVLGVTWDFVRSSVLAPFLNICVHVCLAMSIMVFIERVNVGFVILIVKLFGWKPEKRYKFEAIEVDVEKGYSSYPMVLVQIPMYNEKEVYKLSIGAACGLSWPSDRLIIQVLDDSTDPTIKGLVELECQKWENKGINIKYETRDNRNGHKAGNLKQGLKHSYAHECDFVAIFDADFQPDSDFLEKTVPFFVHNPEVGLEMSFNYQFRVEQEVGSATYAFFGFNGRAGVWRMSALNEAGGWNDRTTVEDMDLAIRASLKGWKFVYVGHIKVKNELPSTFKAFRFQPHRWSCGPANLFKKMFMEIIRNKKVNLWKKLYIIYSFFFVGKIVGHFNTFFFYCVIIPATVFVPEVEIPKRGLVYIPSIISILNAIETPRSFYLVFNWIFFQNVMSMHRTKATFIGLLDAGRVNEWVVTEKLGDALLKSRDSKKQAITKESSEKSPMTRFRERIYPLELWVGLYILVCASYDLAFWKYWYFHYLFAQAIAFFIAGFGYIGTQIPN
ncbi:hypothetical protein MKW98_021709 [Papaver atlanticum]|uniref:Glycosyltransferase 2-like domain-containing protein n=1 Tax=Papaver atlanticum TaxID=357466 RepID=A0AAD4XED0_9MAGN|nr:hypothetical protein MKW98_021709 [Papaver atlanticum]